MHRIFSFLPLLFALIAAIPAYAQVSPEILPDGRVTFRITAPEASDVSVKGQWTKDPVQLIKGEKGLWEGTSPEPVQPGIWEYGFIIDKVRLIDSRNPDIKPQRWPKTSIIHINSDPPAHWDLQHIPHGVIHSHDYYATTLNKWRRLVVYTPPNYQQSKTPLPVLYLSHGFSDNQESWWVHGHAQTILDSMINRKLVKPMLIVMPDAHPVDPEGREYDDYRENNTQAFAKELIEDVLPFLETHYTVQKESSGRAFAGLSMGGGHAFTLAFQHNDLFSQIGAFSASAMEAELIESRAQVKQMNKNLKLFWIPCGDQDFLLEKNKIAHATMTKLGINHEFVITEGDNHSWPVWRRYLIELLPKLFRD